MDQVAHEVRHQKWLDLINQCNASGLTRKEWCRLHGISTKTFYYRQKQLRNEAFALSVKSDAQNKLISSGTAFAEIEVPQPPPTVQPREEVRPGFQPDAVIRTCTLTIEVSNNASRDILSLIQAVVTHAQ